MSISACLVCLGMVFLLILCINIGQIICRTDLRSPWVYDDTMRLNVLMHSPLANEYFSFFPIICLFDVRVANEAGCLQLRTITLCPKAFSLLAINVHEYKANFPYSYQDDRL